MYLRRAPIRRRPALTRLMTFAGVAGVLLAMLGEPPALAEQTDPFHRLTVQDERVVTGAAGTVRAYGADQAAAKALRGTPATPTWPAADIAVADLGPASGGVSASGAAQPRVAAPDRVRAGTLPVVVSPATTAVPNVITTGSGATRIGPAGPPAAASAPGSAPGKVSVRVLDHRQTSVARPDALLLRVARADGVAAPGQVYVEVDYSGFRTAFGADWGQRLHIETLPECALTDPAGHGCQGSPLASRNNASTVGAVVPAAAGAGTLLAVTAGASGSTGSFAATSLSPSGSWEAGGSSGDFSWSYPLHVPPSLGGPSPKLALTYSSQSVDGRHAASNNQPSWIGEGFEMGSGYVERRYKSCADDMDSGANNTTKTGDQCWGTDNATMSLGGKTTELIKDDATGAWHPKNDDGSKVEHLTGGSNGDNDGEYWKVTTADGTQYFFGRNRLPGWSTGKPETNSTWTVPIFGNHAGEQCHQTTFDASWCTQAWRWNLDHVVDLHGNSLSYWYSTETNKYARDLDSTKVSGYTRGGYLTEIDYGTRASAEFGTAPARVLFTVADRCLPGTTCDSAHPASWPDVPWDQNCTGTTCTQYGPTFWTTKRLSSVKTQVWGGTAYRDVESWTLKHSFPDPGDSTRAGLWLTGIGHSGLVGGTASVPDITFTGVQMPNRVDTIDHSPAMNWWRIASIRTETGGEISVGYSGQDCVAGSRMPSAPESNTLRCYPVVWTPQGYTSPVTDYFHKYVVTVVSETDHTGGAPRVSTTYAYKGSPAWHYTDDDGLIPASQKTWSQWRGYETVAVTKGDPGEQSYGETHYFRGMDGDHLPSGTRKATVTDSRGGTATDSAAFSGRPRERITFNGPGGAEVSSVLTDMWQSAPTATHTANGVTTTARYVNTAVSSQRVALDGGRGFRETRTATTYDSYGLATQVDDQGDVADPGDDQCTTTTYVRNTAAWLMTAISRKQVYALGCGKTPTSAAQVVADTRMSFDGQAFGAAPTKGDVTLSEELKDWSNGTTAYVTTQRSQYDANGRVTDVWDTDGNHTATAYTPATGGPVTRQTVTNPLGFVTTTDLEPAWGATTGVTDPNGRRTDVGYDPLGRTTSVWKPGRAKGVQSANTTFGYLVRTDGPAAVTTNTLGPNGAYITTYTLYDGLLRARQTQSAAVGPAGGSVITDTFYDTAGRTAKTNATYVTDTAPGTTLFVAAGDNQIAAQTVTLFDGADRPTASVLRSFGAEKWRTSTYYGGDHTDITPPAGGVATATYTDGRGRTVEQRRYHGSVPAGGHDSIVSTYTPKNAPASVTDQAGNAWTYGYDVRGRQTRMTDPDRGTQTSAYDDAGHLLSTTDGRGRTLAYTYDALGRKTAEYDGSTSGTKLAEWTYDTLAKGQATSSTRYDGGNAYVSAVTGYDAGYRPTGTKITIPGSEGALAGIYQFATTYKPDGSVSTTTLPAAGGLAQEVLGYTYTYQGKPATLGGLDTYVTAAEYTRLGETSVLTMSTGGPIAQSGLYYDEATRRLTRILDVRETAPSTIADLHLAWNPAGDVTAIADTPTGGTADTQCFGYEGLRRLAEAWTPGDGNCSVPPSTAGLGGPAPYWQSYTYDAAGNRGSRVEHTAAGDTTTTYTYPAAGAARPHAVTSSTTAGQAGSRTSAYTYDTAGNTLTRPGGTAGQTLTWDAENRLASVADGGDKSGYVYDTTGARLIRRDATGSTLYLPGTEVRATSAGQTSATRYYTFGSATVAQRTSGGVSWLMSDHQGTPQISVAATATQPVTRRRQKPFGESRGTPVTWPGERGFVGGVNDPTGLVHLGAREYDAGSGRFISPDPVFDGTDPGQMIGYGYAANSPVTASDPSGLRYVMEDGGGGGDSGTSSPPPSSTPAPTQSQTPPPPCDWLCSGWQWISSTPASPGHNPKQWSELFGQLLFVPHDTVDHFTDGDPFAESLKNSPRMKEIIQKKIKDCAASSGANFQSCGGSDSFGLGGKEGTGIYVKDIINMGMELMHLLDPVVLGADLNPTFLGSFDYEYTITRSSQDNLTVSMHVTNTTSWESFLRPPVWGYKTEPTKIDLPFIGPVVIPPWHELAKSLPQQQQQQDITFTTTN
ncbi:hypothetical protein Psi02_70250 [Planotetraspora silvatica]|uniref:Teneurin-like YD-shell domain-containing protein n=1 Tax=Planotetraspora silvatica TaxID=234614 RepID=A0A8J3XSK0_9ACTN|nr:RHS repeat-associated core domain-containing protein [Planotetraspora silvatica]GII50601.1 hypothetical protein Psi02_70250 [Planotetraspora silvatica]